MDTSRWEQEYQAGRWSYLRRIKEAARYGIVSAYVHFHLPSRGRILDVGCGEAILYHYLDSRRIERYVGFDVAQTAIDSAGLDDPRVSLSVSTMEAYRPADGETFDAIIFNEVLFFTDTPMEELERYRTYLAPGGIIIVSLYQPPREDSGAIRLTRTLWDAMDAGWEVIDETTLTNEKKHLTWKLRVAR